MDLATEAQETVASNESQGVNLISGNINSNFSQIPFTLQDIHE